MGSSLQTSEDVLEELDVASSSSSKHCTTQKVSTLCAKGSQILLGTLLVYLNSSLGEVIEAKALLDFGGKSSFISRKFL